MNNSNSLLENENDIGVNGSRLMLAIMNVVVESDTSVHSLTVPLCLIKYFSPKIPSA